MARGGVGRFCIRRWRRCGAGLAGAFILAMRCIEWCASLGKAGRQAGRHTHGASSACASASGPSRCWSEREAVRVPGTDEQVTGDGDGRRATVTGDGRGDAAGYWVCARTAAGAVGCGAQGPGAGRKLAPGSGRKLAREQAASWPREQQANAEARPCSRPPRLTRHATRHGRRLECRGRGGGVAASWEADRAVHCGGRPRGRAPSTPHRAEWWGSRAGRASVATAVDGLAGDRRLPR